MRKTALLLAGLTIATLAMTATTATAATQVGRPHPVPSLPPIPCPAVLPAIDKQNPPVLYANDGTPPAQGTQPQPYQSGGCTVRMTGIASTTMYSGTFGNHACLVDFDIHVGPDGWGYADDVDYHGVCDWPIDWETLGSRIIMPAEVVPELIPGMSPYTGVDADTDFNIELFARHLAGGGYNQGHGFMSLDVTASKPVVMENQYFGSPPLFSGGSWRGNSNLVVTHN